MMLAVLGRGIESVISMLPVCAIGTRLSLGPSVTVVCAPGPVGFILVALMAGCVVEILIRFTIAPVPTRLGQMRRLWVLTMCVLLADILVLLTVATWLVLKWTWLLGTVGWSIGRRAVLATMTGVGVIGRGTAMMPRVVVNGVSVDRLVVMR